MDKNTPKKTPRKNKMRKVTLNAIRKRKSVHDQISGNGETNLGMVPGIYTNQNPDSTLPSISQRVDGRDAEGNFAWVN